MRSEEYSYSGSHKHYGFAKEERIPEERKREERTYDN
jgi:hypothetical protein